MIEAWLPADVSTAAAAFLVFASFFSSLMTAAFGIGGGLMMLAIMTFLMPVAAIIPVHGAVQFGSNAGRCFVQRRFIAVPELCAFAFGGLFGAAAGASVVVELPEPVLLVALGLFVIAATWVKLPALQTMGLRGFAVTGAITTFITMFVGATGPLNLAAFEKSFADRKRLVATLAALMMAQHALKLAAFGTAGFLFGPWIPLISAMMITGYAGTLSGSHILHRASEKTFRSGMRLIMTVIALDMLRRGAVPLF